MDIIITQQEKFDAAMYWLDASFPGIKETKQINPSHSSYYFSPKHKKVVMYYDKKIGCLVCSYFTVCQTLLYKFDLSVNEVRMVLKNWVEKKFGDRPEYVRCVTSSPGFIRFTNVDME